MIRSSSRRNGQRRRRRPSCRPNDLAADAGMSGAFGRLARRIALRHRSNARRAGFAARRPPQSVRSHVVVHGRQALGAAHRRPVRRRAPVWRCHRDQRSRAVTNNIHRYDDEYMRLNEHLYDRPTSAVHRLTAIRRTRRGVVPRNQLTRRLIVISRK